MSINTISEWYFFVISISEYYKRLYQLFSFSFYSTKNFKVPFKWNTLYITLYITIFVESLFVKNSCMMFMVKTQKMFKVFAQNWFFLKQKEMWTNVFTNETLTKIYTNHQLVIATKFYIVYVYCILLLIHLLSRIKILFIQFRI